MASALGLLVAVALGGVLLVTLRVVSAQSRDRVAADLEVARTAFDRLLGLRIAAAIDVADLVTQLPDFRARLAAKSPPWNRPAMNVLADGYRARMRAEFAIIAAPNGEWVGSAGWTDASGGGATVVRNAQHAALSGGPTGALVQDGPRLYLVVSVPAREGDAAVGTLTVGHRITNDIAAELAAPRAL